MFRGSTGQVQGLYPWLYGAAMPAAGPCIGVDCISGAVFTCHPLAWLQAGLISNPNIFVTGVPGSGKSAIIKALALRLMAYGVTTFVAGDLKNEYTPLARALGVTPLELGPGLPARLNPLDAGPLGQNLPRDRHAREDRLAEIHRRRIELLGALLAIRLHRDLTPTEEAALSAAILDAASHTPRDADPSRNSRHSNESSSRERLGERGAAGEPTVPQVWQALRDPSRAMARELRVRGDDPAELREMIRPIADALATMIHGSLAGLFDAPTTVALDFTAPIQTVDLSRLHRRSSDSIAMTLACVGSWASAATDDPTGGTRLVVRDELWRVLSIPALVRALDGDLRLSRAHGTIQILATHRLADLDTAAAAGTAEAAMSANLAGSCDVRICLRQDTHGSAGAAAREAAGLTATEAAHIASWTAHHTGRAIWKIGRNRSCAVQLILHPAERHLFHTNERMGM